MLEREYTTPIEYDYYIEEGVEDKELFLRAHKRTFLGKAGRLEDYEGIAKEILSLRVKHFVKV